MKVVENQYPSIAKEVEKENRFNQALRESINLNAELKLALENEPTNEAELAAKLAVLDREIQILELKQGQYITNEGEVALLPRLISLRNQLKAKRF